MAKFVGVERPCEVCGKLFKSPQCHAHVRTCSAQCGYKIRKNPNQKALLSIACAGCGKVFQERPCHAGRRTYCSHECQFTDPANLERMSANLKGDKNPSWKGGATVAHISSSGRRYARQSLTAERSKVAMRRAGKLEATPVWADGDAILGFYTLANTLSISTGVVHHVDHIVPLNSKLVCGLHCQFNLQVLTSLENLCKGNRDWPDKP